MLPISIILLMSVLCARGIFVYQGAQESRIRFPEPVRLVEAPAGVLVVGSGKQGDQAHREYTIYKPLRRLHEYDNEIEEGVRISFSDGTVVRDMAVYGDFSAFYLGVVSFPILLGALFKMFG